MAKEIVNRNIGGSNTKVMSITTDQIVRGLRVGSLWQRIEIGVLIGVNGTGVTVTSPTLAIGICSGQTSPFGVGLAPFCRHFFGARTTGNLTYNASAPGSYQGSFLACRKVGTTVTDGTGGTFLLGDAGNARNNLTFFAVRLARVGTDIVSSALYCSNTLQTMNRTFNEWMYALETRNLNASVFTTGYTVGSGLQTAAIDEATNGPLDTLNVSWNSATPLVIKDIGVSVRRA